MSRIPPLLAAALLAVACGGGSDDESGLNAGIAEGNAQQIRMDYAALGVESPAADASQGEAQAEGQPGSHDAGSLQVHSFAQAAEAAVNLARSSARTCGDRAQPPAGPLKWDARAAHAALLESEWMLATDSFGHVWPGGELVWERLTMSGYRWRMADENIAAGFRNLADAMQAWIDSAPHCVALMRADITEFGIAVVPGRDGSAYLSYWTMVLATPR